MMTCGWFFVFYLICGLLGGVVASVIYHVWLLKRHYPEWVDNENKN